MAAAARPLVSVQTVTTDNVTAKDSVPLPLVMKAAIRPDVVRDVHSNMSNNSRKKKRYAVVSAISVNKKRYAVVSAIAASAVPSLVRSRGHRVDAVPEKTSDAIKALKSIKAIGLVQQSVPVIPGPWFA